MTNPYVLEIPKINNAETHVSLGFSGRTHAVFNQTCKIMVTSAAGTEPTTYLYGYGENAPMWVLGNPTEHHITFTDLSAPVSISVEFQAKNQIPIAGDKVYPAKPISIPDTGVTIYQINTEDAHDNDENDTHLVITANVTD